MSQTVVEPPKTKPRQAGPDDTVWDGWQVIVMNDDHNTFDGVAMVLAEVVPGVGFEAGMRFATEIHNTGSAVVWSGMREPAELYHAQLSDYGLTMAPLQQR